MLLKMFRSRRGSAYSMANNRGADAVDVLARVYLPWKESGVTRNGTELFIEVDDNKAAIGGKLVGFSALSTIRIGSDIFHVLT